jgi:prophage regulatory protein
MKILRRPEVVARTGLSATTIREREAAGTFPARVILGPFSVGWIEEEIDAWIKSLPRAAKAPRSPAAEQ